MDDLPTTWKGQTTVTGYVCSISWENEVGEASDGIVVYSTLDDIKRVEGCANPGMNPKYGCGIYEVEVTIRRVVAPAPDTKQ